MNTDYNSLSAAFEQLTYSLKKKLTRTVECMGNGSGVANPIRLCTG